MVNSSFMDMVGSSSQKQSGYTSHGKKGSDPIGYKPGDDITGLVAILRDKLDVAVAGETVIFKIQYWNGLMSISLPVR